MFETYQENYAFRTFMSTVNFVMALSSPFLAPILNLDEGSIAWVNQNYSAALAPISASSLDSWWGCYCLIKVAL